MDRNNTSYLKKCTLVSTLMPCDEMGGLRAELMIVGYLVKNRDGKLFIDNTGLIGMKMWSKQVILNEFMNGKAQAQALSGGAYDLFEQVDKVLQEDATWFAPAMKIPKRYEKYYSWFTDWE